MIKENLKKRFQQDKLPLLDVLIKDYDSWVQLKKDLDDIRHKRNLLSQEINTLKKQKKDAAKQINLAKSLPDKINSMEEKITNLRDKITKNQSQIPNILSKQVP
ncbi:MAG: serine--tRNA ligase, partial [candidate division Zixibacteria bacterium]|nr:serine--tRNA ligase [candidate division Zixibacteria bacterium]